MTTPPDTLDLYVVRWPKHGLVKVGVSQNQRWREFGGGVELALTVRASRKLTLAIEAETHERLSTRCARPFRRETQAARLLGSKGAGFTECYTDDGCALSVVMAVVMDLQADVTPEAEVVLRRDENNGAPLMAVLPKPKWPGGNGRCGHCGPCLEGRECESVEIDKDLGGKCLYCKSDHCAVGAIAVVSYGEGASYGRHAGVR